MSVVPMLDTHIWIWWLHGDHRLPESVRSELDALPAEHRPMISDISLWEVAMLVARGRLELDRSLESWLQLATRAVKVWPITTSIAAAVAALPESFQRDPADRIIVATSANRGAPLITLDRRIIESGLVRLWTRR
jgi:PIN domain nuclease of toxin-antitoxin system